MLVKDFWEVLDSGKRDLNTERWLFSPPVGVYDPGAADDWERTARLKLYLLRFKEEIIAEVQKSPSSSLWTTYLENTLVERL